VKKQHQPQHNLPSSPQLARALDNRASWAELRTTASKAQTSTSPASAGSINHPYRRPPTPPPPQPPQHQHLPPRQPPTPSTTSSASQPPSRLPSPRHRNAPTAHHPSPSRPSPPPGRVTGASRTCGPWGSSASSGPGSMARGRGERWVSLWMRWRGLERGWKVVGWRGRGMGCL